MKLVIAITGASGVQLNIANIGADKRNRRRNEKSYLMLNRIIYKKNKNIFNYFGSRTIG